MPNKEEWESVEASIKDKDEQDFKKYGLDLKEQYNKTNFKKNDSKIYIIYFFKRVFKILVIILVSYIIFLIGVQLYISLANMKNARHANVETSIETSSNIDIEIISKNVEEKYGNGEYYFKIKKVPEITFKATKNYSQIKDDLLDNLYKYLFENWTDSDKNKFIVAEEISEDGFLSYETYININTYDELISATDTVIKFIQYAENWNKINKKVVHVWQQKEGQFVIPLQLNIYLKKGDSVILPYSSMFQTAEEIKEQSINSYNNLIELDNKIV